MAPVKAKKSGRSTAKGKGKGKGKKGERESCASSPADGSNQGPKVAEGLSDLGRVQKAYREALTNEGKLQSGIVGNATGTSWTIGARSDM